MPYQHNLPPVQKHFTRIFEAGTRSDRRPIDVVIGSEAGRVALGVVLHPPERDSLRTRKRLEVIAAASMATKPRRLTVVRRVADDYGEPFRKWGEADVRSGKAVYVPVLEEWQHDYADDDALPPMQRLSITEIADYMALLAEPTTLDPRVDRVAQLFLQATVQRNGNLGLPLIDAAIQSVIAPLEQAG